MHKSLKDLEPLAKKLRLAYFAHGDGIKLATAEKKDYNPEMDPYWVFIAGIIEHHFYQERIELLIQILPAQGRVS